jgi:hypothetical protein
MKKRSRKILLAVLVLFIIIQFFRPTKNISNQVQAYDITTRYNVPADVQQILKASCYDCHSNNTVYPWYAEVQPVGWWLNNHIKEGKVGLNFSEFMTYPIRRQYRKLEEVGDLIKKDEMPLKSYLVIHTYARLSDNQKLLVVNWVNDTRNIIKQNYPPDSLIRKGQKAQ